MEEKYNSSMEYKRWDQEFVEIRTSLTNISKLSVMAKNQLGAVRVYFYEVEALFNTTSSYVTNKTKVKKELDKIHNTINNRKYLKDFKTLNDNSQINIQKFELGVCRLIDNVFRELSESYVNSELRPKPTKEVKDAWETETDAEEKDKLLALNQIGIKVK